MSKELDAATKALSNWDDRKADDDYGIWTKGQLNWRSEIKEAYESKDIDGMISAALPDVQLQVTKLAFSKNHKVALSASQFLLAQAGRGAITKVENTHDFRKLPTDQLIAIFQSKINNIKKLNPSFDLQKLLSAAPKEQIIDLDEEDFQTDSNLTNE